MLSGIGPAEQLTLREIEVGVDLPDVGQNLQDHVNAGVIYTTEEPVSLILGAEPEYQELFANERPRAADLERRRGGRLLAHGRDAWRDPDLQFHAAPVMFVDEGLGDPTAHGISLRRLPAHAEEPRHGHVALGRPDGEAVDPPQLPAARPTTSRR